MKNKNILLLILPCFFYNFTLFGDATIVFYLRPYPTMLDDTYCQEIKRPGVLAEQCLNGIIDKKLVVGVFATYGGYLNVSDQYGQLSFPYKHSQKSVDILITPKITPIMMAGNTVHHWELEDNVPATMYHLEQQLDDQTKVTVWETKPAELPKNKKIPVQTIIIIAKPVHMYVPVGTTIAQEGANILLPDIFVKKGINHTAQSLYLLNLKHLFEPIRYIYKQNPTNYITHLVP
ncbi:MAG: hypothetical protein NTX86_04215 [Candidatus Dependentiae bacterium]|nr:hypothetical protein [Candidatus Dependentiae bacterium]